MIGSIAVLVITESKTHLIGKVHDNYVLDNRNHYLRCDQLPKMEQVNKVISEHKDTIEQIFEEVKKDNNSEPIWENNLASDGYVSFEWNECGSDNGDILISYLSHTDRKIIEKIINSDTFFGIPYRLVNY